MAKDYDHKSIDSKWQLKWKKDGAWRAEDNSPKPKYYPLIEFPFLSGQGLHIGHPRPYVGLDLIARKKRREGYNVLYPIGWDAFGLPTENYALKTGKDPRVVTEENTNTFRRQIQSLGISFDWSREFGTSDPEYYKWTQWIFLQLYKHGLAYKGKATINWCPKDKIGLANEEVADGKCERCGTEVEKREKEQWMLAITKYAQRLYDDLDTVDYIERAKTQQRNWIGPSQGAEISFTIESESRQELGRIPVFTTRPDTLFGATYVALAPEHPLILQIAGTIVNYSSVEKYISEAKKKTDVDRLAEGKIKTGIHIEGVWALNPATQEKIPLFVADYVLPQYGTGAVMGVPAHDERDFAFAKKFDLPIRAVLKHENEFKGIDQKKQIAFLKDLYDFAKEKEGEMIVVGGIARSALENKKESFLHSDIDIFVTKEIFNSIDSYLISHGFEEEKEKSLDRYHWENKKAFSLKEGKAIWIDVFLLETAGKGFYDRVTGKKFDWAAHDKIRTIEFCGITIKIPEKDLLTKIYDNLASTVDYLGGDTGVGILTQSGQFDGLTSQEAKEKITKFVGGKSVTTFKLRDWVFSRQRYWGEPIPMIHCKTCGWQPVPEDQLPVELPEVEKYQPTDTGESPLALITDWVNTTCPHCKGPAKRETDVMPNWAGSSWYYLRYADPKNASAFADIKKMEYWTPVDWYNGGMEHTVLHLLYSRFWHKFLFDIKLVPTSEPYKKRTSHGVILAEDGTKMSKSKGNVINPDDMVERVGADALRTYEMFMGPFDQAIAWSLDGLIGARKFLERVAGLAEKIDATPSTDDIERIQHQSIKKVGDDIEAMKFNTAVSQLMIFSNELGTLEKIPKGAYESLLLLLAPFAPHVTEELWEALGHTSSIHLEAWPTFDIKKLESDVVVIAVQIGGKTKGTVSVPRGSKESDVVTTVRNDPKLAQHLPQSPKRTVYVEGRIINFIR